MEGNLRFKIDWASLIVGSKFTVFALFYFVFEGNFPSASPWGGLYLEGLIFGILRYVPCDLRQNVQNSAKRYSYYSQPY